MEYNLVYALIIAWLAGIAIPLGGIIAAVEHIQPRWLELEFRHGVVAFGGGALLSAVALVLVPEGAEKLSVLQGTISFAGGGICFFIVDMQLEKRGGAGAQLLAMLLDFLPEAIALGAAIAMGSPTGALLAFLIGIQNLPEGFNAYREITANTHASPRRTIAAFFGLSLLGPLAAWIGLRVFVHHTTALGVLMLFCAGGILYLVFQDIAPMAKLKKHWGPPLGAVAGFLLGMIGYMMTTRG